ncbi:MAG: beta-galactosidase [Gemmiger sp.]|nr:beta-galactosidase [Gemmiger sp.]
MIQADKIFFGGDYSPEQWDEATVERDMAYFQKAGINLLTLPVFAWEKLEPDEGVYNFGWLDKVMDLCWAHGIQVCLATPTSAQPAWLSTRYPEVLPVDIAGRKRTHGMRVFFCVNSLKYRERAAAMAEQMALRYAHHPALAMWHVCNEYGTYCYCPTCQAQFRLWLRKRYGTVESLNQHWHTVFWGRTLTSFEEVCLPTELNDDYRFSPTIQLDYMRFVTDSTAACLDNEALVLKKHNPEIPVMTNMSGFIKKLDQFTMTRHIDLVGWDNYPWPQDKPYFIAMKHDIMRGLKGGQPFVLTEQSPNQQNWQPYNRLKRPGEVRVLSYQALAHGADSCLFFQLRQSLAGQEKFHGAVITHAGHDDTRVYRETAALGAELQKLGNAFLGGRTPAKVGFMFDWNNWWALELASGPSVDKDYLKTVAQYYRPFFEKNIAVDFLHTEAELSGYKVIVAPMLYMTKPGVAARLTEFVKQGGTLLTTVLSGVADENDRCVFGAYPGELREVLGIWVEETDALRPEEANALVVADQAAWAKQSYPCGFLCDILHLQGAESLASYQADFYAGTPCVTKNRYGKGEAYYVGTQPEPCFLDELTGHIAQESGIAPLYAAEEGVELTLRVNEKAQTVFAINHSATAKTVDFGSEQLKNLLDDTLLTGRVTLQPNDVLVAERK